MVFVPLPKKSQVCPYSGILEFELPASFRFYVPGKIGFGTVNIFRIGQDYGGQIFH